MKAVLFTTYHFPPSGGARIRRVLKFLKYLPRVSWKPVVLTAQVARHPSFDASLINELPKSIRIYRTPSSGLLIARVIKKAGFGRMQGESADRQVS